MAAILKWMVVLVLLIAVAGGSAAYWFYTRSDEGLRQIVLNQLSTMAPTLKFGLARAHWEGMNGVRMYGLTVSFPDDERDQPSVEVPEVLATLDPTQLADLENVVVQKLRVVKPHLRLIRDASGVWNWQGVTIQATSSGAPPDIEIEHATISAEFLLPDRPARRLTFRNFNVSAHPADSKRMLVQVATLLEPAGPLTLEIETALDGSTWKCGSRDPWRVPVDANLIQLLSDLLPEFATHVARAGQWMNDLKAVQAVGSNGEVPSDPMALKANVTTNSTLPKFGIRCGCDLSFRVQKDGDNVPPTFKVLAAIVSGEIDNEILPIPLKGLAGEIYADNRRIIVTDVRASNGKTTINFNGDVIPSKPISATMTLRGVELTREMKSRLPLSLHKIVDTFGLTGTCDVDALVTQDRGRWKPKIDLRLTNGTVTDRRFPVTVREVKGELHLENDLIRFDATGRYAGQLVTATGSITDPGPAQQVDAFIKCNNLPLDDESLAACPPDVYKAIESLQLKCRHDVLFRIKRAAGEGQKYEPELNARIYDGRLSFNGFRYSIEKLRGFVIWKEGVVQFNKLVGVHDGAALRGQGTFRITPGPRRLDLAIDADGAAFDRSLKDALPPNLRQVWDQFQPQGVFDVKTKIGWVPGSSCEIRLPSVKVYDGEVTMSCFRWPLNDLNGEFSFNADPKAEPGRLVIERVHARHDDTLLSATGFGSFPDRKPWKLEFTQLNVDNLVPNATFRNALPEGLQRIVDSLRPSGVFSFHGPVAFTDLRPGVDSIGAAWKLKTVLSRCAITAGTRIDEINGAVQLNGMWNGTTATLDGALDLDSISIFRLPSGQAYQITKVRGPIAFQESQFVAGTVDAILPRKSDDIDDEKRIRGDLIDGAVFLDAIVDVSKEPNYRAFMELKNGKLERYAQQYLRGRSKLAGIMNGWINLQGKGTTADRIAGSGKLIIAPAALYELPLFAQLFQMLQLQSPDKAAFEQAEVDYTVANERFELNSINLQGEALKMRGRGYVRFDGGMQLDFGLTRRQLIPNPFKGLIAVKVLGHVGDPKTTFVPYLDLDDGMKQFLGSLVAPARMGIPRPAAFNKKTESNLDDAPR